MVAGGQPDAATWSGYRPQPPRVRAALLTAGVIALPLLGSLIAWQAAPVHTVASSPLAVFDVAAPSEATPPEPLPPPPEESGPSPAEAVPATLAAPPAASLAPPVAAPVAIVYSPAPVPVAAKAQPPSRAPAAPATASPMDWQSRVLGRLNAVKRYPASARARRQQGVALIRFSVDRAGVVRDVVLARSSGFALLDREALALPRRASPLPPPPEDMLETAASLVVPVDFSVE